MAHAEYKNLSAEFLDKTLGPALKGLPTRPFAHQLVALLWLLDKNRNRVCLWHDIGTGKSLIGLYAAHLWGAKRILIVCPKSVVLSWKEQVKTHLPHKQVLDISDGPAAIRKQLAAAHPDHIHVTNYEGLLLLFGIKHKVINKKTKKEQMKTIVDPCLSSSYDMILFDEIQFLANPQAIQTNIAAAISEQAKRVLMMTGTPISSGEENLWSEYFVLDQGKTLGENYYVFLNTYFHKYGYKLKISQKKRENLLKRISPVTLRYAAEECQELPPIVYQQRLVKLSDRQQEEYDCVLKVARGEFSESAPNENEIGNTANRLYQICSGFRLGKDKEVENLCDGKNPKIDELREVLLSTAKLGKKILVVHNYVEEARQIEALCKRMDLKYASFRSEVSVKDKQDGYTKFKNGTDVNVFIFHPRSAGVGLNLQNAHYICFFSLAYLGVINRLQSIGRVHRAGQKERCVVIDLLAKDTIETEVSFKLTDRVEIVREILNYIQHGRGTNNAGSC